MHGRWRKTQTRPRICFKCSNISSMNSEALQLESTHRLGWSSSAGTGYFSCLVLLSHKPSKQRLGRIRFREVNNADQDLNLCLSGYKPQIFPLKHRKLWKRQSRSLGHFQFHTTRDFYNSHLTNSVSSLILGFATRAKEAKINEVVLQRRISKWHSGGGGEGTLRLPFSVLPLFSAEDISK